MSGSPALFLSYSGAAGGAERVLLDCATRLGSRPVVIACPEGPLAAAARHAGLAVEPLAERPLRLRGGLATRLAHLRGLVSLAGDARRLARRHEPAVTVAWGGRAILACALPGAPRPLLAVHHDLLRPGAVGAAVRAASRRADAVAAASRAIARDLRAAPVMVMHPGVDLTDWVPEPPPPPDPPRALVLGALVPWKRADLALEVAARIPELRLTIAGAPLPGDTEEFESALQRRADQPDLRGRVEFAGALPDPRTALAQAHCLLHCADAEPWGLALVEALAAGRPVVAPAAGGPLEILDGGPSCGRLYPPGDPAQAATALRAVLADPEAPAAARRRAEEAFDVGRSAARFTEWLEAFAR